MSRANGWRVLAACAALLLLPATAAAAEKAPEHPDWTVNLAPGLLQPDEARNLDDVPFGVFGLERRLSPYWGLELRLAGGAAEPVPLIGEDVNMLFRSLDLLIHFEGGDGYAGFEPYMALGGGDRRFSTRFGENSETQFNAGGGLRYVFNERWSMRGDVRYFDSDAGDVLASLGISYAFGGISAPPAPARPEPLKAEPVKAVPAAAVVKKDTDGDGVMDAADKCPGTLPEFQTDASGCEIRTTEPVRHELVINFVSGSAAVHESYMQGLKHLARFLRHRPDSRAVIEGHTDNVGSADYNLQLSLWRAQAIRDVMVQRFGVDGSRLEAMGYGEARPISDNDTVEGRARNRRVYALITLSDADDRW